MLVSPISSSLYTFEANKPSTSNKKNLNQDKNPVSKAGEKANLVKATFITGAGIALSILCEMSEGDSLGESITNITNKYVKPQKKLSQAQEGLLAAGSTLGILGIFVGGFALLYTLFKLPFINYMGNLNTFKKKKEMDAYIKGNKIEKDLYTQMNDKAKTANAEEKEKLREQYAKMQMAKNKLPDFMINNNNKKGKQNDR